MEGRDERFLHPQFRIYLHRLTYKGIKSSVDAESFMSCVRAIDEDVRRTRPPTAARSIFARAEEFLYRVNQYNTSLDLQPAAHRELGNLKFIPRLRARRRYGSFNATKYAAVALEDVVSPTQVVDIGQEAIAWTQVSIVWFGSCLLQGKKGKTEGKKIEKQSS